MSKPAKKMNTKLNSKLNTDLNKSHRSKTKQIKIKVKKNQRPKPQRKAKAVKVEKKIQEKELIIIDEKQGLIFENEKTLFGFFSAPIKDFEKKYLENLNLKADFSEQEQSENESLLEETLDEPDEIWIDDTSYDDLAIHTLVKQYETKQQVFHYVAVVYINTEDNFPTFVFNHFATKDQNLLEVFRKNEIIYHKKLEAIQFASVDGDSLMEGDYLAIGLLESMMILRSEKDIETDKFKDFAECRDNTINSPDEIWRKVDSTGHVLVNFIKEFPDMGIEDLHYVVVTEEDTDAQVNSLLFSFPTKDLNLLERYQQGENLEAEEVATESSH